MEQDTEDHLLGTFAIMWDCHGLEACERVPSPAHITFALLKGDSLPELPKINHWALRAKFNPQRNYEIYVITAQPGIERDDIVSMFDANPQSAADTIRRIGQCYYSDRSQTDKIAIV